MNPKTGAGAGIELDGSDTHDDLAEAADRPLSYRALARALLAAAETQLSATSGPKTGASAPQRHKVLDK
jgi:hypothetical protein